MRTPFSDSSLVENQNLIGVPNGRYAMRHDDGCPLAHRSAKPIENFLLRVGIHRRQRIIENENLRIDQQRACNGGALLLTARQGNAAFTDGRVVSVRKSRDILVETGN